MDQLVITAAQRLDKAVGLARLTVVELNLYLVRYLVAVVDEGHFGRAAVRLDMSGPALE